MKYSLQEALRDLNNPKKNLKLKESTYNKVNLVIVSNDLVDDLEKALKKHGCEVINAYTYFNNDVFVFYKGDLNGEFDVNEFDYLASEFGLDRDELEEISLNGNLEDFLTTEIDNLEPIYIDIEEPLNYAILSYYDDETDETYYASDDVSGYTTDKNDAYHFKKYEIDNGIYDLADMLNVGRSEIKVNWEA